VELIWFLRGDTNIKFLHDNGVHIWDEWADENGELGPVYGAQWRRWKAYRPMNNNDSYPIFERYEIDQIANLVRSLKADPYSRRQIVSAWNTADIPEMKLPPCHTLWQCYVETPFGCTDPKFLSLHLVCRSIDSFLGLPFNIASYATLLHMIAMVTDMTPKELIISFSDLHLYKNHFDQAKLQLTREPRELPTLIIPKRDKLEDYQIEDFVLVGYNPHPAIKAPIAV
jgi:thymidylate synthase